MKMRNFALVLITILFLLCFVSCNVQSHTGNSSSVNSTTQESTADMVDSTSDNTQEGDGTTDSTIDSVQESNADTVDSTIDSVQESDENGATSNNDVDTENEDVKNESITIESFAANKLISGNEFLLKVTTNESQKYTVRLEVDGFLKSKVEINGEAKSTQVIRFTHLSVDSFEGNLVSLDEKVVDFELAVAKIYVGEVLIDEVSVKPVVEKIPRILYVSKYVTMDSEGNIDTSRRSLLSIAINGAGYSIKPEDMYNSADDIMDLSGYDLYIFEGVMPKALPTDGAVWLLDAKGTVGDEIGIVIGNAMEESDQGYRIEESEDAITEIVRNVIFDAIKYDENNIYAVIATYCPIAIAEGSDFESIYETDGDSVFVAGIYENNPMIITSFDFQRTSLIAFVSDFPILIRNMIRYSVK